MAHARSTSVYGFDWAGKRVLVTGASGFKGSWLCQVLRGLGAEVYGTTRASVNPMSAYNLMGLGDCIAKVHADLSRWQEVSDVVNSVAPHVVFHLAAKAQVPVAERDPKRTYEVNVMGTVNLLEACRQLGVCERLIVVSTDHVFGNNRDCDVPVGGFKEDHRVSYGGPYDTSKSAMELCVRSYVAHYHDTLPMIGITRAANVFGFGDVAFRRVLPIFVKSALETNQVPLTCLRNGRQFIYVSDVIEGYIRAASWLSPENVGLLGNDATDCPLTPTFHFALEDYGEYSESRENFVRVSNLAKLVGDLFDATPTERANCEEYASNENRVQALNCRETYERLGWEPQTKLRDGVLRLKNWYTAAGTLENRLGFLRVEIANEVEAVLTSLSAGSERAPGLGVREVSSVVP